MKPVAQGERDLKTSPRRRAREFALQGLYQWQVAGGTAAQVLRNLGEMDDYELADATFLRRVVTEAIREADASRAQLEPLVDRKWEAVSPVERSILLIGAWELMHCPQTPYRVVINEAIELGKVFGGTDGHKYVNGILDRLASSLRPEDAAGKKGETKRRDDASRKTGRMTLKKSPA
jgi:transcription antitermination protein NusB